MTKAKNVSHKIDSLPKDFKEDYIKVMSIVQPNKTLDQLWNAIRFMEDMCYPNRKRSIYIQLRTNTKVLATLQESLGIWRKNTENKKLYPIYAQIMGALRK